MGRKKDSTHLELVPPKKSDKRCPHCNVPLDETGFCWKGGGYPMQQNSGLGVQIAHESWAMKGAVYPSISPFSCPLCRSGLTWGGGCPRCFGTKTITIPDSRTFPGAPHKLDGFHWVATGEDAGQRVVPLVQAKKCFKIVHSVLCGDLSPADGLAAVNKVLEAP